MGRPPAVLLKDGKREVVDIEDYRSREDVTFVQFGRIVYVIVKSEQEEE